MTTEGEEIHAERRSLQSTEEDDCFLKFEKGQWLVEEKLVHRVNVSRNPMRIEVLDPEPWRRENVVFYI